MMSSTERAVRSGPPRASLAIDSLRAVVILLVLVFHSVLAYLSFLPAKPPAFDSAPFMWRSFPIIDTARWFGFDLFCAWLDVFLMSFFFLLSGLFVWPSLSRKGARTFLFERVLRLGVPFAAAVLLLMPVAHYPTYLQTVGEPGLAAFWRQWRELPLWPSGPMWFLLLLLVWDCTAAAVYPLLAARRHWVLRLSAYARTHPARFLTGVLVASAIAYVPLALVFGPSAWFQRGPFSFQLSRPGHYAVYFFAGAALGACGIERGLLAPDGSLARHWKPWLVAALGSFALWLAATSQVVADPAAPLVLQIADDFTFVLACFASCFFALAVALRFARLRSRVLDSLKANAYGMYLIHYLFIVWLQFALLGLDLPAVVKAAVVFCGTLAFSWSASAASRRVRAVAHLIGDGRPRPDAVEFPSTARAGAPARLKY